jgi:exosortase C (VPDSG-CTERM-specific)
LIRKVSFIGYIVCGVLVYIHPLLALGKLSFHSELYSHFLLIPPVSAYFLWMDRRTIFQRISPSPLLGISIISIGIAGYGMAIINYSYLDPNDYLSLCTFGFTLWFMGGFVTIYGFSAFRRALFPLLFLLFLVPIPLFILEQMIRFLQVQSANATQVVFEMIGVPYLREGMVFRVPGIAIEVAKECSGIRSSLALFITSIVAGQMFLDKGWNRALLVVAVIPLTIFKNSLRITTLAMLAAYVDPSWITDSWLHRMGGKPFFILALCLMLPLLWLLRQSEKSRSLEGRKDNLAQN